MLIKEYRIALPMNVDEYRIAQLYMIQVGDQLIYDLARSAQILVGICGKDKYKGSLIRIK